MLITVGQKSFSPDGVASSKLRHLRTGLSNPKHRPPGQLDDPIYFGLVDCHSVGGATLRGSFSARLASVWVPESHQRSVRKPSIWSSSPLRIRQSRVTEKPRSRPTPCLTPIP